MLATSAWPAGSAIVGGPYHQKRIRSRPRRSQSSDRSRENRHGHANSALNSLKSHRIMVIFSPTPWSRGSRELCRGRTKETKVEVSQGNASEPRLPGSSGPEYLPAVQAWQSPPHKVCDLVEECGNIQRSKPHNPMAKEKSLTFVRGRRSAREAGPMGRECEVSGKKTCSATTSRRAARAEVPRRVGKKTTGVSRRTFKPNLQWNPRLAAQRHHPVRPRRDVGDPPGNAQARGRRQGGRRSP